MPASITTLTTTQGSVRPCGAGTENSGASRILFMIGAKKRNGGISANLHASFLSNASDERNRNDRENNILQEPIMKSLNGKVMLAVACAGLAISLAAGGALAGDRDGYRGGSHYDRDHRGWSSHYDRYYRGYYRPYYYVGGYASVYAEPVYDEPVYYSDPPVVYAEPVPAPVVQYVYPAPVYRERVVVRPTYRYRGWGAGFYFGR